VILASLALAGPTNLGAAEVARHRALVIGVGAYTDEAFRSTALGAPADADAIAGLLRASTVRFNDADGADKPSEVVGSVTESMLAAAFAGAMKGLGEGDDLFVYFAGHAVAAPRPGGEPGETDLWLLASDASAADPTASAVSLHNALLAPLRRSNAPRRVLVIIDACRNGVQSANPPPSLLRTDGRPGLWAFAYAAQPGARAADTGAHGVFTEALLEGATARDGSYPADTDRSGGVTTIEWLAFALGATTDRTGGVQRPQALLDVRGRERFVLFGRERSRDQAAVWASAHAVTVRTWRGGDATSASLVAVPPGVASVRVEGVRSLVLLRPGEEFAADALAQDRPGKLYVGGVAAGVGTEFGSPFSMGLGTTWVPRDLAAGRTSLALRVVAGAGPEGGIAYPNGSASLLAHHGLTVVAAGSRGLDRFDVGPALGGGLLARWPEARAGGDIGLVDSARQLGAFGYAALGAHVETGRTRVGVELGVRTPVADGSLWLEPVLSVTVDRRVAQWGRR
jgi:hypothetical protein